MPSTAHNLTKRYFDEENWIEKQVKVFEVQAGRDPYGYLQRTIRFSKLATIYLIVLVGLAAVLSAAAIWLLISHPGGPSFYMCLLLLPVFYGLTKSLFVKVEDPTGFKIDREDSPRLWEMVDELLLKSGAPKIDKILLIWDVNAYAAQTQRFGIWGQKRQFLMLGIPLMKVLTPDELRFVIAHEFGHFAGEHGIQRGHTYRATSQLQNVEQNLQGNVSNFLLGKFLRWYMPRMRARSFVLDRQQEYEADAFAARVSNQDHVWALMKAVVGDHGLRSVYERWEKLARDSEIPHPDSSRDMIDRLYIDGDRDEVRQEMSLFYSSKTNYSDTHPSIQDRARALGATERSEIELIESSLIPPTESAFDYFVSPEIQDRIFSEIADDQKLTWLEKHNEFKEQKRIVDQLRTVPDPTLREQLTVLNFDYRVEPSEEVEAATWSLLEQYPENADVNYAVGEMLAEKKNLRAEEYLMKAARLNRRLALNAASLMTVVRRANGIQDNKDLKRMMVSSHYEAEAEQAEFFRDPLGGVLEPTTLPARDLAKIVTKIKGPKIKHAYVVSRTLPSREVVDVLVVIPSGVLVSDSAGPNLVEEITSMSEFPSVVVYGPTGKFRKIESRLDKVPGAKLF